MVNYDYGCSECGNKVEVSHSIMEERIIKCPCGSIMQRLITTTGISFKGNGFHNTDYRKR